MLSSTTYIMCCTDEWCGTLNGPSATTISESADITAMMDLPVTATGAGKSTVAPFVWTIINVAEASAAKGTKLHQFARFQRRIGKPKIKNTISVQQTTVEIDIQYGSR